MGLSFKESFFGKRSLRKRFSEFWFQFMVGINAPVEGTIPMGPAWTPQTELFEWRPLSPFMDCRDIEACIDCDYIVDCVPFPTCDSIKACIDQAYIESFVPYKTCADILPCIASSEAYGSYRVTSSAATTISGANVYTKAAGTTGTGAYLQDFTAVGNNRLRYDGTATRRFRVAVTNARLSGTLLAVVGVTVAASASGGAASADTGFVATVGLVGGVTDSRLSMETIVELQTNGFVEIWVVNTSNATNVTLLTGQLIISGL